MQMKKVLARKTQPFTPSKENFVFNTNTINQFNVSTFLPFAFGVQSSKLNLSNHFKS